MPFIFEKWAPFTKSKRIIKGKRPSAFKSLEFLGIKTSG
jgi:hypothetical protein